MIVHRHLDKSGNVVKYESRLQRYEGGKQVNHYTYTLTLEEMEEKLKDYWSGKHNKNKYKCIELRDKTVAGRKRGGKGYDNSKELEINGCIIVPAWYRRCKLGHNCEHYDECLDVALNHNWNGWRLKQGRDKNELCNKR